MAEKSLLLQILDHLWKEHLLNLDHLRQGIHLRGYGQRDPLNEYKREAFALFEGMLTNLRQTVTQVITHLEVRTQPQQVAAAEGAEVEQLAATGTDGARPAAPSPAATAPGSGRSRLAPGGSSESWGKVGRNAALPLRVGQEVQALPRPAALSRTG